MKFGQFNLKSARFSGELNYGYSKWALRNLRATWTIIRAIPAGLQSTWRQIWNYLNSSFLAYNMESEIYLLIQLATQM